MQLLIYFLLLLSYESYVFTAKTVHHKIPHVFSPIAFTFLPGKSSSTSLSGSIKGFLTPPSSPLLSALSPIATFDLYSHLTSSLMIDTVCQNAGAASATFVNGTLFEPVPYSPATPHGMPLEIQDEYYLKEDYVVVNVPPTIMFKAKVFKPSRLCCVFAVEGLSEEKLEEVRRERQRVFGGSIVGGDVEEEESTVGEGGVWDGVGKEINSVWKERIEEEKRGEEDDDFDFDEYMV